MDGTAAPQPAPTGREGRRRVGSLLGAYYSIDGASERQQVPEAAPVESELDRTDFDAKRYFDGIVGKGQIPQVLKSANELDAEVRDLDGDMNMIVYENYSKFLRSMDCTRGVRTAVDGLDPELKWLEGSFQRIAEHQRKVDEGVSGRARQIEALLKKQRVCKKLRVLFELPATLRRCLDAQAYGKASEAYCCCAPFLRQYRHIETFKVVLEEVDLQMGRVRSALEQGLHSSELKVDEAVNSSLTLIELGQERAEVAKQYLSGRAAVLQGVLESCFEDTAGTRITGSAQTVSSPLEDACCEVNRHYVTALVASVEGFHKLQGRALDRGSGGGEDLLADFVGVRVEALFERISGLLMKRLPSSRALVSSIGSVREALRKLHAMMPQLLTKLFTAFLNHTAAVAVRSLFTSAWGAALQDLKALHTSCKPQKDVDPAATGVPEEVAQTEQSVASHALMALEEVRPILGLVGADSSACRQLARTTHECLAGFFVAFLEVCRAFVDKDVLDARHGLDTSLSAVSSLTESAAVQELSTFEWQGPFALALVWVGRRMEETAVTKAWAVAKDTFANWQTADHAALGSACAKTSRLAAEEVLTHFVMVSGQRLAHFFRNAAKSGRWKVNAEPKEPSLVVEMLLKEVRSFDHMLGIHLGDPRRTRGGAHQRRLFKSGNRNSAELEVDRLMAKNVQVFASVALSRSAAVVAILRIAFKAFAEYMREETLGKFGLQQVQMDCAMLAEVSRGFVDAEEAGSLEYLLWEVVDSALHRCTEPTLMEDMAVELLCDDKKRALRLD